MNSRRQFLESLRNIGTFLLQPFGWLWATRALIGFDAADQPFVSRFVGQSMLPGHDSTALMIGKNLADVQSVNVRSRHVSVGIVERSSTHLVLRVHTSWTWREGVVQMRLTTGAGCVVGVPVTLFRDPTRVQYVPAYYASQGYGAAYHYYYHYHYYHYYHYYYPHYYGGYSPAAYHQDYRAPYYKPPGSLADERFIGGQLL